MEPLIAPVTELSESDSDKEVDRERLQKPRRRRQPRLKKKRAKANETVQVQVMLSKDCKHGCRAPFRARTGLQKLLNFRNDWVGLHKTDQDTVELWFEFRELVF